MKHLVLGLLAAAAVSNASPAQACVPTGFMRDSINLTAALVNPLVINNPVNATGCDIGIYFSHGPASVNNTEVYGARYFGIPHDELRAILKRYNRLEERSQ